jgi:hypothetical protein
MCSDAVRDYFLGTFGKLLKAPVRFVMPVCLSVRIEKLDSQRKVFNVIRCLNFFFGKFVQKIQGSLKPNNNNRYCTCRPIYICDHISLGSSYNETFLRQNL